MTEVTWEEMLDRCVDSALELEGAKFPAILEALRGTLQAGYALGYSEGWGDRDRQGQK